MRVKEAILRILDNEDLLMERIEKQNTVDLSEFKNHTQNIRDLIKLEGLTA